ncbi:MAG: Fe-S cluster assembly protein SufD [Deltaproteobacteria bacterium]|nr:Fe-S cluster assembly protein SufD [Deltaproteobacteria bacterium]
MTTIAQAKTSYQAHFSQVAKELGQDWKGWVRRLRETAISRFGEMGFPTLRDEEWKYTNVALILDTPFQPAPYDVRSLRSDMPAWVSLGSFEGSEMVFVNSHYSPEFSSLGQLPRGVEVGSLAAAVTAEARWVESHLARYACYQERAFVALNTALMQDGAFVYVPEGKVLEGPIHLLFISAAGKGATVSHPRILIVIGKGAQASIIESYTGRQDEVYFTNAVTEIVIGENAVVEHYKLQRESERAFHMATLEAHVERGGNFLSHSVSLGGALTRNEINAILDGEGCECALNGLYIASGEQHIDNHTRIDHVKPHGTSRELYKGILDGRSRGVFNGKIYVHKTAEKSDAKQTNNNLLLSRDALIDTKPQLEIYNNDVKCSHGSTIGRLDQDSIFYLRSRGIGVEAARNLLTYAFASDVINRIKVGPMREQLDQLLTAKFHGGS